MCLPGAYRSACVELKLHNLAVCAIVNAHMLPDLGFDPSAGAVAAQEAAQVGGAQATAEAFRLLRSLVSSWLADATERSNPYADRLLTQLYRWLSSPASRFRDPLLLRLVRVVMRKLFRLLLAELHKLGAKVVYADFGSITIATGKRDPQQAAEFVGTVRQVLLSRDLFSWLDVAPQRFWHALLFRDPFNYGGVVAGGEEAEAPEEEEEEEEAEEGAAAAEGAEKEGRIDGAGDNVLDECSSPAHTTQRSAQTPSRRAAATPQSASKAASGAACVKKPAAKRGKAALYDSSDDDEEAADARNDADADAEQSEGGDGDGDTAELEDGGSNGPLDGEGEGASLQMTPQTPTQTGRSRAAGEIVSNWNICEFLPEAIQQHFEARRRALALGSLRALFFSPPLAAHRAFLPAGLKSFLCSAQRPPALRAEGRTPPVPFRPIPPQSVTSPSPFSPRSCFFRHR